MDIITYVTFCVTFLTLVVSLIANVINQQERNSFTITQ